MSVIRKELVNAAREKAVALNNHDDIDKQHELRVQAILADGSLTKDEKSEAIRLLSEINDYYKVRLNIGKKRICENCQLECLATLYCEHCIRKYLKANFSNWTSGNNDIDDLIQECQLKTISPGGIVEWIPYNDLQNTKYLTKGGFSEIYMADWIGGNYFKWDSKEQQLKRIGTQKVILKRLEDVKSANRSWFEEAKSHLTISNKWASYIALCYGLTKNPSNNDYFLVIYKMDIDLRNYLKQNHNQLTWKERTLISGYIIESLYRIHNENAIHRDLHSGNILYFQELNSWYISDLGFCGPADKPLGSIYGNLPYIAPEVIAGKGYTFASDIYSIAMLMWEISSGQPPFANFEYSDYDLAMNIINGMRPKILPGIPLEYKELMVQCWDADPLKRPDVKTLLNKIFEINRAYYQHIPANKFNNNNKIIKNFFNRFNLFKLSQPKLDNNLVLSEINLNYTSSNLFTSKIYQFENCSEPKNATEEEQEAFHSKAYSFNIPNNIDNFNNDISNQSSSASKIMRIFKENSKKISKKLQRNSNNNILDIYKSNVTKQKINIDDEVEIYNNPNLHSEEQDELEIPDDGF